MDSKDGKGENCYRQRINNATVQKPINFLFKSTCLEHQSDISKIRSEILLHNISNFHEEIMSFNNRFSKSSIICRDATTALVLFQKNEKLLFFKGIKKTSTKLKNIQCCRVASGNPEYSGKVACLYLKKKLSGLFHNTLLYLARFTNANKPNIMSTKVILLSLLVTLD